MNSISYARERVTDIATQSVDVFSRINMKASFILAHAFCIVGYGLGRYDEGHLVFPDGFSIGAAISAHQSEGAWNVSDKSENIWDHRTHINASLFKNSDNADVACDSYHKYKEDVALAKSMGLNHYRFSISWSRVLPTGSPDQISEDGVQYYHNLIDELLKAGIEPYATLYHFDDVQSLVDKTGGWVNESMIEYFAEYSRVIFREFGRKVKFWTTVNEIDVYCKYLVSLEEVGLETQSFLEFIITDKGNESFIVDSDVAQQGYGSRYICAHNLLKAHARAYHIYDEEFRPTQHGKIGLVTNSGWYISKFENDTESVDIAFAFEAGWILNPIFSKNGDYPKIMKDKIAENSKAQGLSYSRLPEFHPFWIQYIRGTSDYLGINHYITTLVEPVNQADRKSHDDSGLIFSSDPQWRRTARGWGIVPKGLGDLLRKLTKTYDNPVIYVMESGMSDCSDFFDFERISYLYEYMKETLLAIADGCDVRAYTIWSFLDVWEHFEGYTQPFGLVHVDFNDPNRTRTPKLASYWLTSIINERRLMPYNHALLDGIKFGSRRNGVGRISSSLFHVSIISLLVGMLSMT